VSQVKGGPKSRHYFLLLFINLKTIIHIFWKSIKGYFWSASFLFYFIGTFRLLTFVISLWYSKSKV